MPGLRDLQAAFSAYLKGEDRRDLADAVVADTIAASARLRIHRHHVAESLATALGATFSTVQTIVGDEFFRAMAGTFVVQDLPRQPVMAEYGAGFPAFVGGYGPATSLPYLADMARLDWALNMAFHAPLEGRLTAPDLAGLPAERLLGQKLALAAGSTLVWSPYPVDRIWQASRPGATVGAVSLEEGPAAVIVLRRPEEATFVSLSLSEAAFMRALDGGASLEEGAEAAFSVDPAFDLAASFARLLALEAFAALQQIC